MKKYYMCAVTVLAASISGAVAVMPSASYMSMQLTPEGCAPFLQGATSIEYHYMSSYTGTKISPYKTDVPATCCKTLQYGCFLGPQKGYVVQGCGDCRPNYTSQDNLLTVASGTTVAYNSCQAGCTSKNYCADGSYGCSANGSTGCTECPYDWDNGPFTQTSDSQCNFFATDCYLTGESYSEYPGKNMDQDVSGIFQLNGNCYYAQ